MSKIDTVWLKSWNRAYDEISGTHWPVYHTVYGAGDTIVFAGRSPDGLISIPESCRYTPVWVLGEPDGYIPGRMLFGDETLTPGAQKTELPLDGLWEPLPQRKQLDATPVSFSSTEPISIKKTYSEIPSKKYEEKSTDFSSEVSGVSFLLLSAITIYWMIGSMKEWKNLWKDLRCMEPRKHS